MLATPQAAVEYLLQCGLVTAERIVAGDVAVVDVSRRNLNFKVVSKDGPSYLLKQGIGPGGGQATVAREAMAYELLTSFHGGAFRRFLPGFYHYNPEERALLLELLPDVEDLSEYLERRGRFPKRNAAALGVALATLHSLTEELDEPPAELHGLPRELAWGLTFHHPSINSLAEMSWANIDLIKTIQRIEDFTSLIDEARSEWKAQALVHFDLRPDNCLLTGRHRTGVKIVDWEFAGIGDPCWDVGSVFSNYLSSWVFSIPPLGDLPPERLAELARYPLSGMQPAIRAFWNAYIGRSGLEFDTDDHVLRAVKYAGVRLLETAYVHMQTSAELTGHARLLLQLSLNILRRPRDAALHLLGLPIGALVA